MHLTLDRTDVLEVGMAFGNGVLDQQERALNSGQWIVDFVRDTSGKTTHRAHRLGLPHRLFCVTTVGHIREHAKQVQRCAIRGAQDHASTIHKIVPAAGRAAHAVLCVIRLRAPGEVITKFRLDPRPIVRMHQIQPVLHTAIRLTAPVAKL